MSMGMTAPGQLNYGRHADNNGPLSFPGVDGVDIMDVEHGHDSAGSIHGLRMCCSPPWSFVLVGWIVAFFSLGVGGVAKSSSASLQLVSSDGLPLPQPPLQPHPLQQQQQAQQQQLDPMHERLLEWPARSGPTGALKWPARPAVGKREQPAAPAPTPMPTPHAHPAPPLLSTPIPSVRSSTQRSLGLPPLTRPLAANRTSTSPAAEDGRAARTDGERTAPEVRWVRQPFV